MSSSVARASKYSYRSSGGGGSADVSIEYSADLTALSRLEVKIMFSQFRITYNHIKECCEFCDFFVEMCSVAMCEFHKNSTCFRDNLCFVHYLFYE